MLELTGKRQSSGYVDEPLQSVTGLGHQPEATDGACLSPALRTLGRAPEAKQSETRDEGSFGGPQGSVSQCPSLALTHWRVNRKCLILTTFLTGIVFPAVRDMDRCKLEAVRKPELPDGHGL